MHDKSGDASKESDLEDEIPNFFDDNAPELIIFLHSYASYLLKYIESFIYINTVATESAFYEDENTSEYQPLGADAEHDNAAYENENTMEYKPLGEGSGFDNA